MPIDSRGESLYSLGVLPALMGIGHLAPAIGAIHSVTGEYQFPVALLGMIGAASCLVDSYDTYKDLPRESRPRRWIWKTWIYSLWAAVFLGTYLSGFETALKMYRFSLIGLLWGTPCVPGFSKSSGFSLIKPKTTFREGKSLVVAVCMGIITVDTSIHHICHQDKTQTCNDSSIQLRSLGIAILYQFFRETACDVRDVQEDTRDKISTLPVRLGRERTVLAMGVIGTLLDALMTGAVRIHWSTSATLLGGTKLDTWLCMQSIIRVCLTMAAYWQILKYPRKNCVAWGVVSLLGLLPVLSAQGALLDGRAVMESRSTMV